MPNLACTIAEVLIQIHVISGSLAVQVNHPEIPLNYDVHWHALPERAYNDERTHEAS